MRFAARVELAMRFQQSFEMHVDIALVGDEAHRAVGQPLGAAHVLDRVAERQLEDRDQAGELGRRLRLLLGIFRLLGRRDFVEIDPAASRRLERLFLVHSDRGYPEFVDRIGQQQDLDAARAEPLELRALFQ